jgi:hypothetical protein
MRVMLKQTAKNNRVPLKAMEEANNPKSAAERILYAVDNVYWISSLGED